MSGNFVDDTTILEKEYTDYLPFFEYVKARLKLDISRLVRRSKLDGKVFFTIRVKSFASLIHKLNRKGRKLESILSLDDEIFDEKFEIHDIVGIRLICLDDRVVKELFQYLLNDNSIVVIPEVYYQSILSTSPDNKLANYLEGVGFDIEHLDNNEETFRRYEDINMYLAFRNIRDFNKRYGPLSFETSDSFNRASDGSVREHINKLGKRISPDTISKLPLFRIETQIMTFTMYMFNEIQRPEYILRKGYDVGMDQNGLNEIRGLLENLKMTLSASSISINMCRDKTAGPFLYRPSLKISHNFEIGKRLPKNIDTRLEDALKYLNTIAASLADDAAYLPELEEKLDEISDTVGEQVGLLGDRYENYSNRNNDTKLYFEEPEHVDFWLIQRVVLMMLAMVGGFSKKDQCVEFVCERLSMRKTSSGTDIMLRVYEHINEFDKICRNQQKDGSDIIPFVIDPIINWRHATAYYQTEDFKNAIRQIDNGIKLYHERNDLGLSSGKKVLPPLADFYRRRIDYKWCQNWADGNISHSHYFLLIQELDEITTTGQNRASIDRVKAYKCIIAFNAITAGDIANKHPDDEKYITYFGEKIQDFANHKMASSKQNRKKSIWWELACAISAFVFNDINVGIKHLSFVNKRMAVFDWHPETRINIYEQTIFKVKIFAYAISTGNDINTLKEKNTSTYSRLSEEAREALSQLDAAISNNNPHYSSTTTILEILKICASGMELFHDNIQVMRDMNKLIE